MSAHRYWRLNITNNNGAAWLQISEIEFRGAPGGADLTSPSSTFIGGPAYYPVANAFDDNTGTYWSANFGITGWLGVDFGAGNEHDILEFTINCYDATRAPRNWTLEWSNDGVTWNVGRTFIGEAFTNGVTRTFVGSVDTTVTFDGIPATNVTVIDAFTIDVDTPAHAPGAVDVVLTRPDSISQATAPGGYTYDLSYDGPHITSVDPDPAKAAGGETMTVNGYSMRDGCVVRLAGHDYSRYSNKIVNGTMEAPGTSWGFDALLAEFAASVARLYVRRHEDPGSISYLYTGGWISQTKVVPQNGSAAISFLVGGQVSAATPALFYLDGQLLGTFTTAGVQEVRTPITAGSHTAKWTVGGSVADAYVTIDNCFWKVTQTIEKLVNGAMDAPGTEWGGNQSCPGGTTVSFTAVAGVARLYARSWIELPDKRTRYWEGGQIDQVINIATPCNGTLDFSIAGIGNGESVAITVMSSTNAVIYSGTHTASGSVAITFPMADNYTISFGFAWTGTGTSGAYVDVVSASLRITPTDLELLSDGAFTFLGDFWDEGIDAPATNGVIYSAAGGNHAELYRRAYADPATVQYIYEHGEITQTVTIERAGAARIRGTAGDVSPTRPLVVKLGGVEVGSITAPGNFVIEGLAVAQGDVAVAFSVGGTEFDQYITLDNAALEAPPPWMIEWVSETLLRLTTPQMVPGPNVIRVTNPDGLWDEYTFMVEGGVSAQPNRRRTIATVNY